MRAIPADGSVPLDTQRAPCPFVPGEDPHKSVVSATGRTASRGPSCAGALTVGPASRPLRGLCAW